MMKSTLKTLYAGVVIACSLGIDINTAQEVKKVEQGQATDAAAAKPAEQDAQTQQVLKLIKEKNYDCLNCHQVDTKSVAVSFKEVAAKRKNDKWAQEKLTQVIKGGGEGEYEEGARMPPHAQFVSEADIKTIVDWILSL